MKAIIQQNRNGYNFTLMFFILVLTSILACKANAQAYVTGTKSFYAGVEASMGTRSIGLTSDLTEWNKIKSLQRGQTYGLVVGASIFMSRVKFGAFEPVNSTDQSHIKLRTVEIGVNVYPLQALRKKKRYFEPYLVTSFDQVNVKLSGTYMPPASSTKTPGSGNQCSCTCPNSTSPTSVPPTTPQEPIPFSGKIATARVNVGLGLQVHALLPNNFLNLFAEMKYGMPLGTSTQTTALLHTKSAEQVTVEFGVSMGIARNKSFGFYRFIRRRR